MGVRHWFERGFSEEFFGSPAKLRRLYHADLTLVHVIPASGSDLPIELDLEERLQSAKKEAASRRIEELQSAAIPTHGLASPSDRFETC